MNAQLDRLITRRSGRINMNLVRQPYFGNQRDQASRYARTIRLLDTDLQVRSADCIDYFFAQLGKQLRDDVVARQSLPVLRLEKFLPNDTFRIDEEITRGLAMPLNCPMASVFSTW